MGIEEVKLQTGRFCEDSELRIQPECDRRNCWRRWRAAAIRGEVGAIWSGTLVRCGSVSAQTCSDHWQQFGIRRVWLSSYLLPGP